MNSHCSPPWFQEGGRVSSHKPLHVKLKTSERSGASKIIRLQSLQNSSRKSFLYEGLECNPSRDSILRQFLSFRIKVTMLERIVIFKLKKKKNQLLMIRYKRLFYQHNPYPGDVNCPEKTKYASRSALTLGQTHGRG